jgi:hypothetical protein
MIETGRIGRGLFVRLRLAKRHKQTPLPQAVGHHENDQRSILSPLGDFLKIGAKKVILRWLPRVADAGRCSDPIMLFRDRLRTKENALDWHFPVVVRFVDFLKHQPTFAHGRPHMSVSADLGPAPHGFNGFENVHDWLLAVKSFVKLKPASVKPNLAMAVAVVALGANRDDGLNVVRNGIIDLAVIVHRGVALWTS